MNIRNLATMLRFIAVLAVAAILLIGGVTLAQNNLPATEGGARAEALGSQGQPDGALQEAIAPEGSQAATETGIKPEVESSAVYVDGFAPDDNPPVTANSPSAPSAVFSYYTIVGPEMQPRTTANNQAYGSSGCSYMTSGTGTGLLSGSGLHIPDDSVIKYIRLYYYDINASAGVDAYLTRYAPGTSVSDLVFTGSTNAFAGGAGFVVSPEITETVNTAAYTYMLYGWPDSASNTLQYCGIRVAYYAPTISSVYLPMLRR